MSDQPLLPLITSPLIPDGFRHGFSTRQGGVSAPPFDSLNLGKKWGDRPESVEENRRRLLAASGTGVMHLAAQVHGAAVLQVGAHDDPARTAGLEADALISDGPGLAVAVYVADCVPVLMADPRTGAFAAVHAGWRGVVAGVVPAAVAAMGSAFGSHPADLRVALGPAISACCFEVGPEVAAAFTAALPGEPGVVIERPGRKPHVDLRRALALQLQRAGVPAPAVDARGDTAACTVCDPAGRFFSYRRDRGRTGTHIAFVTGP
jgi:hypothetical protein